MAETPTQEPTPVTIPPELIVEAGRAALVAALAIAAKFDMPGAKAADLAMELDQVEAIAAQRIGELEQQLADVLGALQELVAVKRIKDHQGTTLEYARRKPFAWDKAFQLVDAYAQGELRVRPFPEPEQEVTEW